MGIKSHSSKKEYPQGHGDAELSNNGVVNRSLIIGWKKAKYNETMSPRTEIHPVESEMRGLPFKNLASSTEGDAASSAA